MISSIHHNSPSLISLPWRTIIVQNRDGAQKQSIMMQHEGKKNETDVDPSQIIENTSRSASCKGDEDSGRNQKAGKVPPVARDQMGSLVFEFPGVYLHSCLLKGSQKLRRSPIFLEQLPQHRDVYIPFWRCNWRRKEVTITGCRRYYRLVCNHPQRNSRATKKD